MDKKRDILATRRIKKITEKIVREHHEFEEEELIKKRRYAI